MIGKTVALVLESDRHVQRLGSKSVMFFKTVRERGGDICIIIAGESRFIQNL